MKKIIIFYLLINLMGCQNTSNDSIETIYLNIKDKKLQRFFSESIFYRLKGISYKDSISSYKFKINNNFLSLKTKNRFINGFQTGYILEDSISFYLHDLKKINSSPLKIIFNNYKEKNANFLPLFSRENLELLKNRSSKIYRLQDDFKLSPYYLSEEYSSSATPIFKNLIFHSSSRDNLNVIENLGIFPKGMNAFLIIHNPLTGLYTILPDLSKFHNVNNTLIGDIKKIINYEKQSEKKTRDTINIDGTFKIYNSLNFSNSVVNINSGSSIIFSEEANLNFSNSSVYFVGSKNKPIKILGVKNNSIFFDNSDVEILHAEFYNLSNYETEEITLPSAITFYNSKSKIENSSFEGNLKGDDYINFYNSNFIISNSKLNNTVADAIDSDFSSGTINGLVLDKIGNDGLDLSGSVVSINNSSWNRTYDKAISAGESSDIVIKNSKISNSELAIVVKDGSKLLGDKNLLINNKIDYAVFFKKNFYSSPILELTDFYEFENSLFQKGVILKVKTKNKIKYIDDVESLLYGKIYGRASD
ncbi:MAG: hypothetical protein HOK38_06670 [Flavobacteriaceae bacterium]|nr:hypothetical protein [Flavobacteriaceae bacterium]